MTLRALAARMLVERADRQFVQFFRYALVSAASLAVDFAGLYALTELAGLHYLASAVAAYALGMVANYLLSVLWVFPARRLRSRAAEFLVFSAIGLAGMGLNVLLVWVLTEIVLLHYLVSRAVSAVAGYTWKYAVHKLVLFR
jgi:putative flippase GtrA